ncbi:hypothetical protein LOZ51_000497 [Ophidiomyces ophidiicola]|nr:hypothetical protein LOZ55_001522 [Ophidiomyces ophidiicola]KAI1993869.1 hypothetical protein LOZ54_001220 [Ophidiomyces ophidiicola]KAI2003417.1 hypothetical protein LOZ51_000497 [Ophidiomyces ophidiicola]
MFLSFKRSFFRVSQITLDNSARSLSIYCRGKPISHQELFEYTNGRFLVNEKYEFAKRYLKFNVSKLCEVVSDLPTVSSTVLRIDKIEGGFNKALLLTMKNGMEVIAKLPCPNAGPLRCNTASEVATLELVRTSTSIPAPGVLAWNSDPNNPVGAEYIIQEKSAGRQLCDVWGDINEPTKFRLIRNLSRLEGELVSIKLPAYGNLYFRGQSPGNSQSLDGSVDQESKFCVGPSFDDKWPGESFRETNETAAFAGPWTQLSDLGTGLAKRGIWHLNNSSTVVSRGPYHGSIQEHETILEDALKIIPIISVTPLVQRHAKPVLWHTDLHLGNIFVADNDPTEIVGIIDWQYTTARPLFTQVRWPSFLAPPEGYELGMIKPELPPNFEDMDNDQKAFALAEKDEATRTKCYESGLAKFNSPSFFAMNHIGDMIQDFYTRCDKTYLEGIIPLRDSLIEVSENWSKLGLTGECPVSFSQEEIAKHLEERSQYRDWLQLRGYAQQLLYSDDEGWIPPQLDFEEMRIKHKELFELYLQKEELSEEEGRKTWFYSERA